MPNRTGIEWTESTWNPTTGCTKVSEGCRNCYAEVMARRLKAMGQPKYVNGFELTLHPESLEQPLLWRKPRHIFVNSMSDLFHPDVPDEFICQVFDVMNRAHWHTYQVLTKRMERVLTLGPDIEFGPHIWMGTSVEDQSQTLRISHLRWFPASVKFVSFEPLLGPIPDLNLKAIHWAIVGGESGPRARPMEADWVRGIRDACLAQQVPFFFKQWGGKNKKAAGRILDGRIWDEMPVQSPSHAGYPSVPTLSREVTR